MTFKLKYLSLLSTKVLLADFMSGKEDVEIIKIELPKSLAEKFRRYVAEEEG